MLPLLNARTGPRTPQGIPVKLMSAGLLII